MTIITNADKIRERIRLAHGEKEDAGFAEDRALRDAGWTHTSELGARWLWRKTIQGRGTIYVPKAVALSLVMDETYPEFAEGEQA